MRTKDFLYSLATIGLIVSTVGVNGYGIELDYKGVDNQNHSFSRFEGKYLLVDTMATWCGPCILSMPHLKEVKDLRGEVLEILSLSESPSSDTPEELAAFKETHGGTWEFGIDYDLKFQDRYDVIYLPTYFLFDPSGNLLLTFNSTQATETADYLQLIDPLLPGNYSYSETGSFSLLENSEVRLVLSTLILASLVVVLLRMVRRLKTI